MINERLTAKNMKDILTILLIPFIIYSCGQVKKGDYDKRAVNFNDQAIELIVQQKYDSALILLNKAIHIDSNYYLAYSNKVTVYCQMHDFDDAIKISEKLLKIKPDLAESWTFTGLLYDNKGDSIKAKQYYSKSIEIYNNRIAMHKEKKHIESNKFNRAISMILLGNTVEGKDELIKLKGSNIDSSMINEYINKTKQDYIDQLIKK